MDPILQMYVYGKEMELYSILVVVKTGMRDLHTCLPKISL
jgi:hypothetical protein